jgi:hypothetical protein
MTMKTAASLILLVFPLAAALLTGENVGTPAPAAGTAPPATAPGAQEMRALAEAYPNRIAELALRRGEWAVRVDDVWFTWAQGRLLSEDLSSRWEEYSSYRFYNYSPGKLPPLPRLDEDTRERLQQRLEQSAASPPLRHPGFLNALYDAPTRGTTEARLRTLRLMGFEVRVHEDLVRPLTAVNEKLARLAQSDPEVENFIRGLKGLAGYNWRTIAGTRSRSYHSYGLAIDLEPVSFNGRHTYWRWALPANREWYTIPYEERWLVPLQVVAAFEEQGFVWGGKWLFFDTMHFEYRPEILLLARRRDGRLDSRATSSPYRPPP